MSSIIDNQDNGLHENTGNMSKIELAIFMYDVYGSTRRIDELINIMKDMDLDIDEFMPEEGEYQ